MLMLLTCPAELSSETKPPHFVAFQLYTAPAALKSSLTMHPSTYAFVLPPCSGKAAPTVSKELTDA